MDECIKLICHCLYWYEWTLIHSDSVWGCMLQSIGCRPAQFYCASWRKGEGGRSSAGPVIHTRFLEVEKGQMLVISHSLSTNSHIPFIYDMSTSMLVSSHLFSLGASTWPTRHESKYHLMQVKWGKRGHTDLALWYDNVPGSFISIKADKINLVYPLNNTPYQSHNTLESAFSLDGENLKMKFSQMHFETLSFFFFFPLSSLQHINGSHYKRNITSCGPCSCWLCWCHVCIHTCVPSWHVSWMWMIGVLKSIFMSCWMFDPL